MTGQQVPPEAQLAQLTNGYQVTQAIHVAAELRVADHVGDKPVEATAIAGAVGVDPGALYRLMRALATVGIFAETDERAFVSTPMSELLRSDHPRSFRGWPAFVGGQLHWAAWGTLTESVRTGVDAHRMRFGQSVWEYREDKPDETVRFTAAMAAVSGTAAKAIVDAFDFGRFPRLVDVGGADGFLLATILSVTPGAAGVVFDLPHVVLAVEDVAARFGLQGRLRAEGGSYFDIIPPGGDAYILKSILHDCPDDDCVRVLRNVRAAMPESGRLLVVEAVLGQRPTPRDAFSDINMLVNTGGRERREDEWRALLSEAGFQISGISPTASPFSVIECRPG